ncbi:MAG: PorP/SprF family type IX secretion system membrane protein [Flavobacteriaceae bacterium]|nr:PorP/SprF family type IX secretion system membrane protein [Flavobacteriaceae bacterium]MDG1961583.1 PorP/SprF family type IX secretion system membrane protein [Flavobacteriaceae bacterium]
MKKIIFYGLGLLSSLWTLPLLGQSGLKLTDYYHNPIQYNPAYVGATDGYFAKAFYATQWLGFDQAPTSQLLDIQHLTDDRRNGYGISLMNDTFGAVQNLNIEANYALHLQLDETMQLSLGLKAGLNNFRIDYSLLTIYDPTETIYTQGNLSETKPLVGLGAYVFERDWYIGFATPNLLNNQTLDDNNTFIYSKASHFYLNGGYLYPITRDINWHNSILMQIVNGSPLEYLITSKAVYQDQYTFGIQYDPGALLGAFVTLEVSGNLALTYAYDMATRALSQYAYGNHSFGLSVALAGRERWNKRLDDQLKPFLTR